MSDATIDHAIFSELQEAAGADFVKELVQTFLEEAPTMLQELRDALATGDADTFRRAAHSLKSNSLTFGALTLGAMAREQELGGLPAAQPSNALDALAQEYARVAAALQELTHG
ncbi:Hpt domain-containing protein [Variovorax sp. J22P240]|uniref:Hpt domain-containing protein n=1 Tax=unclassified Variovorax TaxID=663243 RepID=UPI002576AE7E|nr:MULTISPECIES: Hpt domain-containing protein [unclassified Variovorax]MDL9997924.1 Hpt domain-containing protein [Variovorax sp. J22P240]MDM0049421.1 Hpt domain-containing protein [Variovorax sp. J22R115]